MIILILFIFEKIISHNVRFNLYFLLPLASILFFRFFPLHHFFSIRQTTQFSTQMTPSLVVITRFFETLYTHRTYILLTQMTQRGLLASNLAHCYYAHFSLASVKPTYTAAMIHAYKFSTSNR